MQQSPGRIVFPQQRENFGIVERISPASHDGEQFRIRVEPLQRGEKLARDRRPEIASWPFARGWRRPLLAGCAVWPLAHARAIPTARGAFLEPRAQISVERQGTPLSIAGYPCKTRPALCEALIFSAGCTLHQEHTMAWIVSERFFEHIKCGLWGDSRCGIEDCGGHLGAFAGRFVGGLSPPSLENVSKRCLLCFVHPLAAGPCYGLD
jgi:hypothetical protein